MKPKFEYQGKTFIQITPQGSDCTGCYFWHNACTFEGKKVCTSQTILVEEPITDPYKAYLVKKISNYKWSSVNLVFLELVAKLLGVEPYQKQY
jgi:hypothetical protein